VVSIDGTGQPECHPGELRLRGCDNRVDLVASADLGQRVDVPAVLGPDLADQGAPRRRVGLVPGCDVLLGELREVEHDLSSFLAMTGACRAGLVLRSSGRSGWWSITSQVNRIALPGR
jgi:hypothetical protein